MILIFLLFILIIVLAILFFKSKNKFIKIISVCVIIAITTLCSIAIYAAIEQEKAHREFHNAETDENIMLK